MHFVLFRVIRGSSIVAASGRSTKHTKLTNRTNRIRTNLKSEIFNLKSLSSLPSPLGDQRNKSVETFRSERNCPFLFCAHVGGHQQFRHFESGPKIFLRLSSIEKALHEIA